ncbi:hypothetical protein K438DRAFT_2164472 [Mycena galopus ATCC 62051]|nr:hypothetical protein K438DRAFT_2164472 [Mycena galopus ATCC 62051]
MASSMFRLLFCCCFRPSVEDDPTVIPTETTHLISGIAIPSPGLAETIVVDQQFQHLQDRLGTIVRSTEGKMVNVSVRAPFILQSAPAGKSRAPLAPAASSPTHEESALPPPTAPTLSINTGPPVFTMTPACVRFQSRYSTPTVSRSSSCRRTSSSDRHTFYAHSSGERGRKLDVPNGWLTETETESESSSLPIDHEPKNANGVAIASPVNNAVDRDEADPETRKVMSIAFSWNDA